MPKNRLLSAWPVTAGATVALFALSSCSGGGGPSAATGGATEFSVLAQAENTDFQDNLTALSKDQCKAENDALPLKIETVPGQQGDQKLQLLASQDALPVLFPSGVPSATKSLWDAGQLVDLEVKFEELGLRDSVKPAALSTVNEIFGRFDVLPFEYNIEGFWYNKEVFADNGIQVPTTWDGLLDAADKLHAAGVQPFSASGEQGWPLTRLISGYLYRDLGPDALTKIQSGEAKLTDPEYVAAAKAVADLGKSGYFGDAVGSIDYDTSVNRFTGGNAAIMYMGSWVLPNFADKSLNKIGNENIGFFPVPEVKGGSGSIDQTPANVGVPYGVSSKLYNDKVGAWLSCITKNYAGVAQSKGAISGFTVSTPGELDGMTKLVQEQIDKTKQSVLWFEALMSAKGSGISSSNAAPLVTGSITPEDFMSKVQATVEVTK